MDTITRAQARAQGRKRFFTGEPCRKGHIAQRYVTTGNCLACLAAANENWRTDQSRELTGARRKLFQVRAHPDDHAALFALAQALALDRGVVLAAPASVEPPRTRSREQIQQDRARILGETLALVPDNEPPALGN